MKDVPYQAPEFTLSDKDGATHSLKDYRGKWVVLYFYPKDDTPGCTTEACSLRDSISNIRTLNAEVIGISADDAKSHAKFAKKYDLDFMLLSDESHEVISAYGAWGPKMFGREGIQRKTFLIDPEGVVQKVYGRVTPLGHGGQVIEDLQKLQAA